MAPKEVYPDLDGFDSCPKCNQDFIGEKEPELHYGCKSVTNNLGEYTVLDEWLRRTCKTCSYQWRENTWAE